MTDPLIGKQLGDYQIRGLLGRGGMARVYAGYDPHLDRLAAVKVIANDFAPQDKAEYYERFQREARAIARLNHPNIVGIYQFGQYEDQYYMAMVFVEGRDLRQVLRDYNEHATLMPFSDVLNVARGIGSALDYAHARGVIHRDVKPSNIMIARDKRAVLTDFGLALSSSDTTLGETFGSAHYIAPEQAISSANATSQSDLYSLGVCIYEMLTGRVPFDDASAMTVALKHLQEPPPPPRQINPDISPAVEYVLLRALEKDPARRYATAVEFARTLKAAYENQQLPDTVSMPVIVPGNPSNINTPPMPNLRIEDSPSPASTPRGGTPIPRPLKPLPKTPDPLFAEQKTATLQVISDSWDDPIPPAPSNDADAVIAPRRRSLLPIVIAGLMVILVAYGIIAIAQSNGIVPITGATATASGTARTLISATTAAIPIGGQSYTATLDATATATATPSGTITRSGSPSLGSFVTNTASSILTNVATNVATNIPPTNSPAPSPEPAVATNNANGRISVQLVYDNNQVDFINVGSVTISSATLKKISFKQDQTGNSFDSSSWLPYSSGQALPPQTCYQALIAQLNSLVPLNPCPHVVSFWKPSSIHIFWTVDPSASAQPTTFQVLYAGQVIQTCTVSTSNDTQPEQCSFTSDP